MTKELNYNIGRFRFTIYPKGVFFAGKNERAVSCNGGGIGDYASLSEAKSRIFNYARVNMEHDLVMHELRAKDLRKELYRLDRLYRQHGPVKTVEMHKEKP